MVGWTLNFEMFFYVVFAVSLAVMRSRKEVVLCVFFAFAALVALGLAAGGSLSASLRHFTNPLILEFLMGAWIALVYRSGYKVSLRTAVILVAVGLCLVYFSPSKGEQNVLRIATWGLGFACVVAAATLRRYELSNRNVFVLLGEASYSIYLTHWFVLLTPPVFVLMVVSPGRHSLTYAIVILSLTITVGVLVHFLFERRVGILLRAVLSQGKSRQT